MLRWSLYAILIAIFSIQTVLFFVYRPDNCNQGMCLMMKVPTIPPVSSKLYDSWKQYLVISGIETTNAETYASLFMERGLQVEHIRNLTVMELKNFGVQDNTHIWKILEKAKYLQVYSGMTEEENDIKLQYYKLNLELLRCKEKLMQSYNTIQSLEQSVAEYQLLLEQYQPFQIIISNTSTKNGSSKQSECVLISNLSHCTAFNGWYFQEKTLDKVFEIDLEVGKFNKSKIFWMNDTKLEVATESCLSLFVNYVWCFPSLHFKQISTCHSDYLEHQLMNSYFVKHTENIKYLSTTIPTLQIAYLVMVHSEAILAINLIKTLYQKEHTFIIHYDVDTPHEEVLLLKNLTLSYYENVFFLEPNFNIKQKGGIELVYTHLAAIIELLHKNTTWDYFINLSGNDFPIKSNLDIVQILKQQSNNLSTNFIEHNLITNSSDKFADVTNRGYVQCQSTTGIIGPRYYWGNKIENFYFGSQWFVLTKAFCEYLVKNQNIRQLLSFMHSTNKPEELFFATALMNSPFKATVDSRSWHYVAWGRNNKKLWEKDIPGFTKMEQLFVRKVYSTEVQEAIKVWLQGSH